MQDISIDVIPKGIIGLIISKSLIFDPAQRANVDVLLQEMEKYLHPSQTVSNSSLQRKSKTEDHLPRLSVTNSTPVFIRQRKSNPRMTCLEVRLKK